MRSLSLTRVGPSATFLVGVAWLAVMGFVAAWPDMEASVFDAATSLSADEKLQTLACPLVIAEDEVAAVRARFSNPADHDTAFLVRTRISHGFVTLVRQDSQQVRLAPGATQELSWPIEAADAAYGRLVLARVLATRGFGQPARESACGVLVLGLSGVRGAWVYAASTLAGLTLMLGGAGWWWRGRRPLDARQLTTARRFGFLAFLVVASLAAGVLDQWLVSHMLLIATVLYLFALLERLYAS
jgi:hypothetical protein